MKNATIGNKKMGDPITFPPLPFPGWIIFYRIFFLWSGYKKSNELFRNCLLFIFNFKEKLTVISYLGRHVSRGDSGGSLVTRHSCCPGEINKKKGGEVKVERGSPVGWQQLCGQATKGEKGGGPAFYGRLGLKLRYSLTKDPREAGGTPFTEWEKWGRGAS